MDVEGIGEFGGADVAEGGESIVGSESEACEGIEGMVGEIIADETACTGRGLGTLDALIQLQVLTVLLVMEELGALNGKTQYWQICRVSHETKVTVGVLKVTVGVLKGFVWEEN